MKRKLLSLLLALAMLLTLLPQAATTTRAAGTSGTCGDNLNWSYNPATGLLTFTGRGDMWDFDPDYGDFTPWFDYQEDITAVSFPAGLTRIGAYAFQNCSGLREVSFPTGLLSIGWYAFSGCDGLSSLTLPAGLEYIESCAFSGCNGLTELSLPENVYLESYAFEGCTGLTSVTVPEGITYLGGAVFCNCTGLSSVSLPNSLEALGWEVFMGCDSLLSVTIPENVESIGDSAFYGCTALRSVTLPEGLISIDYSAFADCWSLAAIDLPDSLENISGEAFSNCYNLRSVALPESLAWLGSYAFENCDSLSAVTFPDSLTEIGWGAFSGCDSLSSVTLPASLKELPGEMFWDCPSLRSVVFPAGLESIGDSAFVCCDSLSSVNLPASLKRIGNNAFYACGGLRTVVLPKSVEKLGSWVFDECRNLKALVVRNPACKVLCYEKEEYFYSGDDSWENLEQVRGDGNWSDTYESWYNDTLGLKSKLIVYGPHDAEKEGADMMTEVEEYDNSVYTYGYRYIENCAKTLNYSFYATNVFSDVKEGKFYEIPVAWAYGRGITSGKDETHFAPNETCTRGQVVTFLWNAVGKPEPTITDCPFVDVKPGKYYYDAMLWALETGVTSGKDETHFAPNETCTRGQVVTFLWNAAGKPEPKSTDCPFVDVKEGKYYYKAMLWALENGVTSGKDATHFAPNETCTRGQVVTFLFNAPSLKAIAQVERADDEEVYEATFGNFAQRMAEARETDNNDERFLLYAQAEAELLDTAAMIPNTTRGGEYAMSRVAPHTKAHVAWGNDDDRLHSLVVSEDFLTRAEREELEELWAQAVAGNGVYDPAAYLTAQGHALKRSYTATFSTAPVTLDWLNTASQADTEEIINCVEGLVEYDELGNLRPALAESWEVSEDGMTYTFHLRHGVKWYTAAGEEYAEVTAQDFVAGFHHMMDCRAGLESLAGSGFAEIVGVDDYLFNGGSFDDVGYRALDDYTLQITLNKPVPFFLTMLSYSIFLPMCEDFYLAHGGAFGIEEYEAALWSDSYTFGQNTDVSSQVYCGPFLLQKLEADTEILCVKNPNYYKADSVTLDAIKWIYDNGETPQNTYEDFLNGIIDDISLSQAAGTLDIAKYDGNFEQYAYVTDTESVTYFGGLNLNRGTFVLENGACASPKTEREKIDTFTALNNKNFRKAMMHAFDKKTVNATSRGEELAETNLRNMYTPPEFVKLENDVTDAEGHTFHAGTFYGEMVQYYCDQLGCQVDCRDGVDGWYKPEAAQDYLAAAKAELDGQVSWPIQIDVVYYEPSDSQTAQAEAYKASIEGALGEENVVVNLVPAYTSDDFYACGYRAANGEAGNFDMFYGSGWSPDYGDPATYLNIFDPTVDGYMLKVVGLF
ncbi:MAG: leucine-rich repeat protein [Oscillospiraceae bacterium]|nr:leucine-rich repeat protein [Oscillospiraceae bacterium]